MVLQTRGLSFFSSKSTIRAITSNFLNNNFQGTKSIITTLQEKHISVSLLMEKWVMVLGIMQMVINMSIRGWSL